MSTVRLYVDVTIPPEAGGLERLQEQIHNQERVQLQGMDNTLTYYGRITGAIEVHGTS